MQGSLMKYEDNLKYVNRQGFTHWPSTVVGATEKYFANLNSSLCPVPVLRHG